ncbi:hypothetical protein MKW94_006872 [Papaver nudicaule]|uniref:non-specific serine/threonine protein kinase n=1 Tax=Papaver nudicaule TaxID=74823 RepID=A0AA41VJI2_PAPNU|nr:hypothetical protein [Papaver nudicaule]
MDISLAQQLHNKIQELEDGDADLKQSMSKVIIQTNSPRIGFESQSSFTEKPRCVNPRKGSINFTNKQCFSILQSMGQALHIVDQNGLIVYWNKAAEQIYGYSASEALGQNINGFIIEERDLKAANEIFQENATGENWTGIFPARNKKGRVFQILGTAAPFYDDTATFVGIICVTIALESFQETMSPISVGTKPLKDDSYYSSSWLRNSGRPTTTNPVYDPWHTLLKYIIPSPISKLTSRLKNKVWSKRKTSEATRSDHQVEASLKNICLRDSSGDYDDAKHATNGVYEMITSRVKGILWSWESQQISQVAGGNEVSRSLSNCPKNKATSSMGNSTSCTSPCRKSYMETDYLNYDITLKDLTFDEQIGRGSCATVYRGLWCGSEVAIKVLSNLDYPEDLLLLRSFRQEVLLMKRLRHPNVVLFMGAVNSPQRLCIVTEFLPRGSLFHLLRRQTPTFDWRRRVLMALDIARGMNYLHRYNPPIIHRDLKSSNLLVSKNWRVKVGDFGLSRLKHATFLTSTGNGTPEWMAPEVIRNEPADEKSDVFSFGVVLWELATLKIPWNDLNSMQVIAAVGFMNQRNEIPNDTNPLWASLIESCWHSDPKCRPTFEEVLEKLKVVQSHNFVQKATYVTCRLAD